MRRVLVTASGRNLPPRINGKAALTSATLYCTTPPATSASAADVPLYGTWVALIPFCS